MGEGVQQDEPEAGDSPCPRFGSFFEAMRHRWWPSKNSPNRRLVVRPSPATSATAPSANWEEEPPRPESPRPVSTPCHGGTDASGVRAALRSRAVEVTKATLIRVKPISPRTSRSRSTRTTFSKYFENVVGAAATALSWKIPRALLRADAGSR